MRSFIIANMMLAVSMFVGCGTDGGHCCGAGSLVGLGDEVIPPKGPAALFDGSWNIRKKSSGTFTNTQVTSQKSDDVEIIDFNFDCSSSYNQDDINITIKDCSWNFITTMPDCLDKNSSIGKVVDVVYSCGKGIIQDGNMTIVLKVTDEQNNTAESNATLQIKRTNDKNIAKVTM